MITDFLVNNFVLFAMLAGMLIITISDVYLDRAMIFRLRSVIFLILALVIFDHLEGYTGNLQEFCFCRVPLSIICYSLRPMIIMMLIFIVCPKLTKLAVVPAILNFLVCATALFSDIAFSFEVETNSFKRGILGYTPYIVTVIYIIMLYCITIRAVSSQTSDDGMMILFITFTSTVAAVLAFFSHDEVVNMTYASNVLLYYMYLYSQYAKRDPLTTLFNRQTFYSDIEKNSKTITGMISIDMNGLKWINDNLGHDAGDDALKAIADCFSSATKRKDRAYRLGGDEFVIVCRSHTEDEMKALAEKARALVTNAGYSCAFGLSCGKFIDEMIQESDKLMYSDKARIKSQRKDTQQ